MDWLNDIVANAKKQVLTGEAGKGMAELESMAAIAPEPETNVLKEFGKGVAAGTLQLPQMAGGLVKVAGDLVGSETVANMGEDAVNYWGEKSAPYAPHIGSIADVENVGDFADYAAAGIGSLVPTVAASMIGGGGAATVAGNVAMKSAVKKGLAKEVADTVIKKALTRGAMAGAGATSAGMEIGSIGADQMEAGTSDPLKAILYGTVAGALDIIPEVNLLAKFPAFKALQQIPLFKSPEGRAWYTRGVMEGFKQAGMEGAQEAAQTMLERAGASREVFSDEGLMEILNAGIIGAIGGGVMGGGAGMMTGRSKEQGTGNDETENQDPQTAIREPAHDPFTDVGEPPHPVVDLEAQEQPVLPEVPKGPLSRAAEAATTIPGIGDIAPVPGATSNELVLDEARDWADGHIQAGKTAMMRQMGESATGYAQRILREYQNQPAANSQTASPALAPPIGHQPEETLPANNEVDLLSTVTDADRGFLMQASERANHWERGSMNNGRSNKTELFPWLKDWGKTTPAEVSRAIGNFLEGKNLGEVQQRLVTTALQFERENRTPKGAAPAQGIGELVAERRGVKGKKVVQGSEQEENNALHPDVMKKAQLYAGKAGLDLEGWSNDDIADFVGKYETFVKGKSRAAEPIASIGDLIAQRRAIIQKGKAGIEAGAHDAATSPLNDLAEPTEAQVKAGNYQKGHVNIQGLDISVENPAGSVRSGKDPDGKPWSTAIHHHYGYIKGTVGKDKDHIDTFIGDKPEGDRVFVVDQIDPKTGKFDEHKVMIGFDSQDEATLGYLRNYDDSGQTRIGAVTEMTMEDFKAWLNSGKTKQPVGKLKAASKDTAATKEAAPRDKIVEKLKAHVDEELAGQIADMIADEYAGKKALGPAWLGKRIKDGWIDKWKLQAQLKSGEKNPEDLTPEEIATLPAAKSDRPVNATLESVMKGAANDSQQGKTAEEEKAEVNSLDMKNKELRKALKASGDWSPESSAAYEFAQGFFDQKNNEPYPERFVPSDVHTGKTEYPASQVDPYLMGREAARTGSGRTIRRNEAHTVYVEHYGEPKTQSSEASYGDKNSVFTKDKADKAREILRKKLSQLNAGLDPEMIQAGIDLAGYHIEAGARSFTDYSKRMVADLGEAISPFLKAFYLAVRNYPGLDNAGMDTEAQIESGEAVKKVEKATAVNENTTGPYVSEKQITNPAKNIVKLLKGLGLMDKILQGEDFHVRLNNGPYTPLVIERHNDGKNGDPQLYFTHYLERGGDLVLDSEMVWRVSPRGMLVLSETAVPDFRTGGENRLRGDYADKGYAAMFAKNLIDQGWAKAKAEENTELQERQESGKIFNEDEFNPSADGGVENERSESDSVAEKSDVRSMGAEGVGQAGRADIRQGRTGSGADAEVLGTVPTADVAATDSDGDSEGTGSRPRREVRRSDSEKPEGGNVRDGRPGTGRTGLAADGTGGSGERRGDGARASISVGGEPNLARSNYHITDPEKLIGGTPKVRFAKNRAAIEAWQSITSEGRTPTPEELDDMAAYTGWGSFGQELFQGSWDHARPKPEWEKESQWLREHLGEQNWKSAQNSIINAHYTDPPTVGAMWDIASKLGFAHGRILEPSMGIGNFFGLMPRNIMERSKIAGIELDTLTGGMAQILYPQANIQVKGYQESKTSDNFYDLIIGNWPFAKEGPADRRYRQISPSLHDYFFLKAMDQVRPGGLIIGVTSSGTMDKIGKLTRMELAKKGELVAAFRLPSGAFKQYAGTDVVTDIIVLKKLEKPNTDLAGSGWMEIVDHTTPNGDIKINEYWKAHPDHVLGKFDFASGGPRGRGGMTVIRPSNYAERLARTIDMIPAGVYDARSETKKIISYITNNTTDRQQSVTIGDNGGLYVVQGEYLAPLKELVSYEVKSEKETRARENQIASLVKIRKAYGALIDAERAGESADVLRKDLRSQYETFVKKYGRINESAGLNFIRKAGDPFYATLAALEVTEKTAKGIAYRPAKILSESTVRSTRTIANPTVQDAYVLARNENLNIDLKRVAELSGKSVETITRELLDSGSIFLTPAGNHEVSDQYLSGNVRRKLREAEAAQADGMNMQRNIEELKKIVPTDQPYYKIEAKLGAPWVSPDHYRRFIADMLGEPGESGIEATFQLGAWKVKFTRDGLNGKPEATTVWGHPSYKFNKLVQAAMNNSAVTVWGRDEDGNKVVDSVATAEANEKAGRIREEFSTWVWKDSARKIALEKEYNEVMNAIADTKYDGSFLNFEGMALTRGNSAFNLRKHQVDAIWRGLVNRGGLYAHEVGTGKTYTMGGIAVESRRYGIARKPLIFAHNANSATVAREIQEMYPAAKVLYVDNLTPDKIDVTMRQIANDDWDAVVVPHSLISRFGLTRETLNELASEEIASLEQEAIEAAQDDGISLTVDEMDDEEAMKKVRSVTAKNLVHARNRIIKKIDDMAMRASRENAVSFEQLGVDMVMVDEVHEFKKPPITTKMRMRGLNTATSDQSLALHLLTGYVKRINSGGGVHIFTGTPITNTLTEIYHMMRYVMDGEMERSGIKAWDSWFNTFADSSSDVELTAAGDYEAVTRLASFVNVPELRRMMGQYTDIVFADDMPEFKPREVNGKTLQDKNLTDGERDRLMNGRSEDPIGRPYKKIVVETCPMGSQQRSILEELAQLAQMFRKASPKERRQIMLSGHPASPVLVETAAANAGMDIRLVNKDAYDDPASKVNRCVGNLLKIYKEHDKTTQVLFMERGFSDKSTSTKTNRDGTKTKTTKDRFNLSKDIVDKLVKGGIPREQIAIIDGKVNKEKRKQTADAMNRGDIRVVIGNTKTLGVGVNMQENLRAIHHLDAPWMPGELEQRNGRGHRQGNKWNTVLEIRYVTEKLDGRRWQVLVIKDRFIKAFLKAKDDVRVIDGDAVNMDESDNVSDLSQTLSEAAGDPRILLREKYKKDIEKLQSRERMHSFGIEDAEEAANKSERQIAVSKRRRGIIDKMVARYEGSRDTFTASVGKETFTDRAKTQEALEARLEKMGRFSDKEKIGEIYGFNIVGRWSQMFEKYEIRLTMPDAWPEGKYNSQAWADEQDRNYIENFLEAKPSVASMEAILRNLKKHNESAREKENSLAESVKTLREAAKETFPRAAELEKKKQMLDDLMDDLEGNPIPPPSWLRHGAPEGGDVYVDGKPYPVTGHKWTNEGYFVTVDKGSSTENVPYLDVTDENGSPVYEERDFESPRIATRSSKESDVKYSVASGRSSYGLPTADIQTAFEPVYKNMPNSPPWRVVQTAAELPKRALDDAAKRGIPQRLLQAVYLGNEVVYVADNFRSIEEAKQVLLEEVVVHHGLRGIMAKGAYEKHMTQAALWYANKRNAEWKELAANYGIDLKTREGRIEAAEEMLGRDARTGMDSTILSKVIAAVKEFLRSVGLDLQYGDAEIRELLGKARRFVEGKEGSRIEEKGTGINYGAMLRSLREQGVTDDQLEAFASWQPGGARYSMSDRRTPDRMTPADLQEEIGELKPRVEKAYEDNNLVLAERLDARLEGLYDRLETYLHEIEGENDAQSHHAAEDIDVEIGLDEELATKYREAFVEHGHSEYGVYATKADAINAIRYVLKEHGSDKVEAATDTQVLEVAKEAYNYRKNLVDRLKTPTKFALARLEDVKGQIVDKGVSLNTTEREVLEADKAKAIEAIETTVRDYDDPSRLLFRAFYEADQQQSPGVVPFNPDRGHFAAGEDLKGSWWTTSYATAQEIAWSKGRDGRTVKIVALPVDKLPAGRVFIQNTNPPGFVYDLFVGLPADVSMRDVQEMPVDTGIRYALADRFSGYVGEMKGGDMWKKIARMLNPLDWSRLKGMIENITPQSIVNGAASFLRNPIFEAEADENKRPFVENGVKREETKLEYLLRFLGWEGQSAKNPNIMERLKKTYSQWESGDRTTEWGRITDEYQKLPAADRKGVDWLLYQGDMQGRVFKDLETALKDPRVAPGKPTEASFRAYQQVRKHIDTVVADTVENISRQFMLDAGLPDQVIEKHLSDYRNRLAERPGWLPRNHGEGDYQVNVYHVITHLQWQTRGDKDSKQALLPYYPGKEVADEIKRVATRMGLKYQHLPKGGQLVSTRKNATAFFKERIDKVQAKLKTATAEEKKILEKEFDELKHAKRMSETMPDEQIKRFWKKSNEMLHKLQVENEIAIIERKKALKQAIEDGESESTINMLKDELKKFGDGRIRVKVYMRLKETKSRAMKHKAEVEKDLQKFMPGNYMPLAKYEVEHRFSDQISEDMYGDMKNDFAMEQGQLAAINKAAAHQEISKREASALRQTILQSTAEVLMARGAGAHRIRRAEYLIEGYDAENTVGAYHDYMTATSGMLSKARYAQEQFEQFRYAKPEVKPWAHRYIVDNLRNMGFADRVSGNLRAVATFTYLGFKISSMLINSTQPWTLGVAELGRHTKRSAVWAIGKAQKDIVTGKLSESEKRLFASEIFKLQEMETAVHEMSGQREGATGKISSFMHALTDKALMPFQEVELLNRKTVILAAYRVFRADGISRNEALQKALAVNRSVNFEMSRANLPGFAQKPLGRTVYALQSFMWNNWNWVYNRMTSGEKEDMKALLRYAVAMGIIGGAMALPGGDELDKLYQMLFGESPKLAMQKWTSKHAKEYGSLGEMVHGFAWHGAASVAGVNISNAIRLQIPIVSPLIGGESLPDAAGGVFTGLLQKGSRATLSASRGDVYRTVENLSPEFLAGALRAHRMASKGATSYSGKILFDETGKPMNYSSGEALKRTLGFQPSRVSERSDLTNIEYGLKAHWKEERSDLLAKLRLAQGEDRKEVMRKIMKFNRDLRDSQAAGLVPIIKAQTIRQALVSKPNKGKMLWEQNQLND